MRENMRYAHFAKICEKCGKVPNMRQSHIRVFLICLTFTLSPPAFNYYLPKVPNSSSAQSQYSPASDTLVQKEEFSCVGSLKVPETAKPLNQWVSMLVTLACKTWEWLLQLR